MGLWQKRSGCPAHFVRRGYSKPPKQAKIAGPQMESDGAQTLQADSLRPMGEAEELSGGVRRC